MRLIDKLKGKELTTLKEISKIKDKILSGWVVSVDPGSKSAGYAIFYKGRLAASGALDGGEAPIAGRLKSLFRQLSDLLVDLDVPEVDLVLVEKVRTSTGHVYLTWSSGALLAATNAMKAIEITTTQWKKNTDKSTYIKSDRQDAEEIGKFAIRVAQELTQEE